MSGRQAQDHCACSHRRSPSPPTFIQATLINSFGLLDVSKPVTQKRHARTPLPSAIRRIANQPTFSTNDSSLTSFLRFSPEIRIKIYRQLLRYNGTIHYGICPTHLCLVCRENRLKRPPEFRHRLFPSILECCRLINQEGSEVLYGENWFRIEHWDGYYYVVKTWELKPRAVQFMRRIRLYQYNRSPQAILDHSKLFPNVKQLSIELYGRVEWWQEFLTTAAEYLRLIPKVLLVVHIDREVGGRLWQEHQNSGRTLEEVCIRVYQPASVEQSRCWKNKSVRWEFEEERDSLASSYGYLGNVKLFLDS